MNIFDLLVNTPMGAILGFSYSIIPSYGVAILVLTLVIKLLMLPLGVKSQKGQVAMMKMRPKEEQLRKKYANDKEKLNQAIMDLYKEEGYNPASGCLPLLLQLPIFWGLYSVINKPLTYIIRFTSEQIQQIHDKLIELGVTNIPTAGYNEIRIAENLRGDNLEALKQAFSFIPQNFQTVDFGFFGLNLASSPDVKAFSALWLIPILAGLTAYAQSIYSMKTTPAAGNGQQQGMNKSMMLMMPLMSVWITFTLPAGVGLYWIISNLVAVGQSYLLNRIYNPKEILAKAQAEADEKAKKKKTKPIDEEEQLQLTLPGEDEGGAEAGEAVDMELQADGSYAPTEKKPEEKRPEPIMKQKEYPKSKSKKGKK